jgi:hypothetical protein
MSIKTFVFSEEKSGEVILVKRSRNFEYDFVIPGVQMQTVSDRIVDLPVGSSKFPFLRKKIEALIFLRTTQEMMVEAVGRSLDATESKLFASESAEQIYQSMKASEKEIAMKRIQEFFEKKHSEILTCATIAEITQLMSEMSERVNLGVYSAMNQERKKLDGF